MSLSLAADARAAHESALAMLQDGGRRVTPDAAAALRPLATELAIGCTWGGSPVAPMLEPDSDPLPTTYRVMLERRFGSPTDFGMRMVEVQYDLGTNHWVLVSDLFFAQPGEYRSKNGSAQGCHRGSPQALRACYTQPQLPVPPGHLRRAG